MLFTAEYIITYKVLIDFADSDNDTFKYSLQGTQVMDIGLQLASTFFVDRTGVTIAFFHSSGT